MTSSGVLSELARIVPPARMLIEPPGVDRAHFDKTPWIAVIRPRSDDEVSRIVRLTSARGLSLSIGGGSSTAHPNRRDNGAVHLDMTGMDRVLEIDDRSQLIRVQAGISVAVLASRLADRRFSMGWSLSQEAPHTLGGVLSGIPVRWGTRYGSAIESIRGLVVVLPNGSIFRETVAPRKAAGPELRSMILGGRGRFGIIVEATLLAFPWPEDQRVVRFSLTPAAGERLPQFFRRAFRPHLFEVVGHTDGTAQLVVSLHGSRVEVDESVACLAELLDERPEVLMGMSAAPFPLGESHRIGWSGWVRFWSAWCRGRRKARFWVDCVASHHLRLTGGGSVPRKAAVRAMRDTLVGTAADAISLREALRERLDPNNLFNVADRTGEVEG